MKRKSVKKFDGWENLLTGLGVKGKDKRRGGEIAWEGAMDERTAEENYAGDNLARRIVELLPRDATREFIQFDESDQSDEVRAEIDRLKVRQMCATAWTWARLYGGSGLFLNTGESVQELIKPLDMKKIKSLISLTLFSRHELQVNSTDIETNLNDPNFGMPRTYLLQPRKGGTTGSYAIHHSRIVRFDGLPLPVRLFVENNYWGDSVFSGVMEAIRDYGMSHGAVAHTLHDYRMVFYKIAGLAEALSAGEEAKVATRFKAMNLIRSVLGAHVLDKEEEFEVHSDTFSGVDAILQKIKERLQAATDIPHTVLFNESPSGLSATGASELESWYNYVGSEQENYLASKLDRIFEVMFLSKQGPTKGVEPKGWDYTFKKLWQLSDKEMADTSKLDAETDAIYMDHGVKDSTQVREERFPDLEEPEIVELEPEPVVVE